MTERGLRVYASCIWGWVQVLGRELDRRCRPHLIFHPNGHLAGHCGPARRNQDQAVETRSAFLNSSFG